MALRIHTKRDVRLVTGITAFACMIVSEAFVGALYFVGGKEMFGFEHALIFAGIVPIIIAAPLTYYMASQSYMLFATQKELRRLAHTDALTGLPNRRSFFKTAKSLLRDAARDQTPCTLLIIDADYFKNLNDSYGHAVGDRALVAIAEVLKESFRQADLLCRVGGEEFAVILPEFDAKKARPLAERVVAAVANSPITEKNAIIEYSISCGLADTSASYDLPKLFKVADDAMYQAKAQGRNRVVLTDVAA